MPRDSHEADDHSDTDDDNDTAVHGEALAASRRMALASGAMVHGFKNQLTIVLGHAQLAIDAIDRGEVPDREGLEAIRRAAEQGVEFSQQLLGLARNPASAGTEVEPGPVLERVVQLSTTMLHGPVHLDVEDDLVMLHGNPLRIEQCLIDLVLNARDALGGRFGTVTIGYRRVRLDADDPRAAAAGVEPGSYGMLSVSDDGTGMDAPVLARASELFFTTKSADQGSGVGLAVVRSLAERAGGGVLIESAPDVGTTVAILLPEVAVEAQSGSVPAETTAATESASSRR